MARGAGSAAASLVTKGATARMLVLRKGEVVSAPGVHGKEIDCCCVESENEVHGTTSAVCLRRGIADRCGATVAIAGAEGLL